MGKSPNKESRRLKGLEIEKDGVQKLEMESPFDIRGGAEMKAECRMESRVQLKYRRKTGFGDGAFLCCDPLSIPLWLISVGETETQTKAYVFKTALRTLMSSLRSKPISGSRGAAAGALRLNRLIIIPCFSGCWLSQLEGRRHKMLMRLLLSSLTKSKSRKD